MNKKTLLSGVISGLVVLVFVFIGAYMVFVNNAAKPTKEVVTINEENMITTSTSAPEVLVSEKVDIVEEVSSTSALIEPLRSGVVVRSFYDVSDSNLEKENDIIEYKDVYRPSIATSYSSVNEETKVLAVSDGYVESISSDELLGNKVQIQTDTYTFVYYSLDDVLVIQGQKVKQGDLIGNIGENLYENDVGKHISLQVVGNGAYQDFEKLLKTQ